MRNRIGLIVIVIIFGGAFFYLYEQRRAANEYVPPRRASESNPPSLPAGTNKQSSQGKNFSNPAAKNSEANQSNDILPGAVLPATKPALIPTAPEFTNLPPETVMENLRTTFHSYQSMFGENPVGTNPEITAALNGGNPKQAQFIREDYGMRMNSRGELIDPWGTPYFFHQLSAKEMEIHSAGPDRVMWTADDLVIK
jgi:hypothetical protein